MEDFLDKFTLEIILYLAKQQKEKMLVIQEKKNIEKQVEIEKLKIKLEEIRKEQEREKQRKEEQLKQQQKRQEELKKNIDFTKKSITQETTKQSNIQKKPQEIKKRIIIPPQNKIQIPPQRKEEMTPSIASQEKTLTTPQSQKTIINNSPQNTLIKQQIIQKTTENNINPTNSNLDLNKKGFQIIEPYLKDPDLLSLECTGVGKNLILKKKFGIIKINQTLNKEQINDIINYFSENAKIPIIQGLLKARVQDLEIAAVISESNTSTFIIKKYNLQNITLQRPMLLKRF